jgi:hypothetical protein
MAAGVEVAQLLSKGGKNKKGKPCARGVCSFGIFIPILLETG